MKLKNITVAAGLALLTLGGAAACGKAEAAPTYNQLPPAATSPAPKAPATLAAPSKPSALALPGTYVVGTDIVPGIWGPPSSGFAQTTDVRNLSFNGVPAEFFRVPGGNAEHVSWGQSSRSVGGDGAQRTSGLWDYSLILSAGDTITIAAPLVVPFALYQATS